MADVMRNYTGGQLRVSATSSIDMKQIEITAAAAARARARALLATCPLTAKSPD
jgi:hypothetical protein